MVWYVPPLSPIQSAAEAGKISVKDGMPDVRSLRIPLRYLANMLTAGDEAPIASAPERMLAMRSYMLSKTVQGRTVGPASFREHVFQFVLSTVVALSLQ